MFNFLKRRPAPVQADTETVQLLADLASRQLFVLSLNPGGEFKGDTHNTAEVTTWMEQNARETAAGGPINIYCYEEGGRSLTPFFSSSEHVSTFIQSDPSHQWKAFTNAGLTGAVLFQYLSQAASAGSQVVLNPRSDEERHITSDALHAATHYRS